MVRRLLPRLDELPGLDEIGHHVFGGAHGHEPGNAEHKVKRMQMAGVKFNLDTASHSKPDIKHLSTLRSRILQAQVCACFSLLQ